MSTRQAAIDQLTVATKAMAQTVARQGGITFHTIMFSIVKNAFEVAVMRLVSVPGERIGEVAGRMPGDMAEEVAAYVARYSHERAIADPAREAPQKIIRRDERNDEPERRPHGSRSSIG